MPFSVPALFFRTDITTQAMVPDPFDLPSSQVLQFDSDGPTIVELVKNVYQNNVSIDPAVNPDGTKKVNLQDNGRLEDIVTVTGKIDSTDIAFQNKLKIFARKLQIDDVVLPFGIFGFQYPQDRTFDLDPDETVGFFIDSIELTVKGESKAIAPFLINLKTGGTLE